MTKVWLHLYNTLSKYMLRSNLHGIDGAVDADLLRRDVSRDVREVVRQRRVVHVVLARDGERLAAARYVAVTIAS